MEKDTFVRFTSHLGNSLVAPSQWKSTDKGNTFSLASPDGHAIIHTMTYTAEGSGTLEEFGETMASGLLPAGATGWGASAWAPIKLGERDARKRDLVPSPESHQRWRLYVTAGGRFYHAIVLNASNEAMLLNGGFYEELIRSFNGR